MLKFDKNNQIYREKYYEGENHTDNYTLDPRMLTWTGILTDIFDMKEDSNFTVREKKLMEYIRLEKRIKNITDKREKMIAFEKLMKLSKLLGLGNISKENWNEEKYITKLDNQNLINGDLEHFDESIKEKQAWLWNNLFFVNGDINRKVKCSKSILSILKPDAPDYDPYKYLEFDYKRNLFVANSGLSDEEQDDIECMIQTLGLNSNRFKRKHQIERLVKAFEFGLELDEPYEYITSWEMTLKDLKDKNEN